MLCNYFLHYDSQTPHSTWHTFVVLGHGIPEGETAYVLRLNVQNMKPSSSSSSSSSMSGEDVIYDTTSELLYNAVNGRCYDMRNEGDREMCPLKRIGCIFNSRNVWANMQSYDHPARVSYSLSSPTKWRALFDSAFSMTRLKQQYNMNFDTLQRPVTYFQAENIYYLDRSATIERLIERRFEKWRHMPTRWDYAVCRLLRECIVQWEMVEQGKVENENIEWSRVVAQIRASYPIVYGFPLNIPDSGEDHFLVNADSNPLVKAVKDTKIHENENPNTVFALAVHVHPYPNRLGTVWIYVAALNDDGMRAH